MEPSFYETNQTNLITFINVDLDAALTFTRIALTSDNTEIVARTRHNARKAYDTIIGYMPRIASNREQLKQIKSKLERLKSELEELGEIFHTPRQ
jgi:hypothetical protein